MACECVGVINAKLKERNTRLTQAIVLSRRKHDGLLVQTEQIETGRGKAKATAMFPTFCPFCGVKYDG